MSGYLALCIIMGFIVVAIMVCSFLDYLRYKKEVDLSIIEIISNCMEEYEPVEMDNSVEDETVD